MRTNLTPNQRALRAAAERAPKPLTNDQVKALRNTYVGLDVALGATTYRISNVNRDVYDATKAEVSLESLASDGVTVAARTRTVLSPADLADHVKAAG